MKTEIILRRFQTQDLNGLRQAFYKNVIPITYGLNDEKLFLEYQSHDMVNLISLVVADSSNRFLGALDAFGPEDDLLVSLFLLPEFQHQGIGKEVVKKFILYIKENNSYFESLVAYVNAKNKASLALVKSCGFHCISFNEFSTEWKYVL